MTPFLPPPVHNIPSFPSPSSSLLQGFVQRMLPAHIAQKVNGKEKQNVVKKSLLFQKFMQKIASKLSFHDHVILMVEKVKERHSVGHGCNDLQTWVKTYQRQSQEICHLVSQTFQLQMFECFCGEKRLIHPVILQTWVLYCCISVEDIFHLNILTLMLLKWLSPN